MARPRNPKSKIPFGGLRLKKATEDALKRYLAKKEMKLAEYQRFVITKHLQEEKYL